MFVAHLVPGYFEASTLESAWDMEWSPLQRNVLWAVALGSTVVPDVDVVYNLIFRGFFNHSTLYTHSLLTYLIPLFLWAICKFVFEWGYTAMLFLLVAIGGLSHVFLDAIVHNTPLLYPLTDQTFGTGPKTIGENGVSAYVTHPIILLEVVMIAVMLWSLRKRFVAA